MNVIEMLQGAVNVADLQATFVESVKYQAEWREAKALDFPDGRRNAQSAAALHVLAAGLSELPEHDPRWLRLWYAFRKVPESLRTTEILREQLGRYGSHGTKEGNASDFCAEYIAALDASASH